MLPAALTDRLRRWQAWPAAGPQPQCRPEAGPGMVGVGSATEPSAITDKSERARA